MVAFSIIFEMMVGMEHLLSALGRQSWKCALEKMQQINLTNDHHTDFGELDLLAKEKFATPKELRRFLKAATKTAISPLTILKQAILLHLHIQHTAALAPQAACDVIEMLMFRCESLIELYGEEGEGWTSKCAAMKSQATTREDEAFQGKEVFLVSKIAKPYLRYLQKIVSAFDQFTQMQKKGETEPALAWRLINQLRSVTGITNNFVMIGRYFMREYGGTIVLLTGALHKDITLYVDILRSYVQRQKLSLCCYSAKTEDILEFVSVLNELMLLNEQLMQVYLGKYFFKEVKQFKQPQWINPNSNQFDTIFKIAQKHSKPKAQERASYLFSQ